MTVRREPNRATIGPASGSEITDPAASESRTSPSCEGSRSRRALTCGIRDAQLAKPNPAPANAT